MKLVGICLSSAGAAVLILAGPLAHMAGLPPPGIVLAGAFMFLSGLGFMLRGGPTGPGINTSILFAWRITRAGVLLAAIILGLILIVNAAGYPPALNRTELIELLFASLFAGCVGFAELTERYRDNPLRLLTAGPTIVYVGVNVAASVAALALIRAFNVFSPSSPHREVYEVLLASFGSISFFRSSIFTARVGGQDVDVGPATFLKSLLETSERMINRTQARQRADDAATIMQRVDFQKAKAVLPSFCLTVVENVTKEEQENIAITVKKLIDATDMDDRQRSTMLGVYLMRVVGPQVLARAVIALGDSITAPPNVTATPKP
jgi:hypothetical protein